MIFHTAADPIYYDRFYNDFKNSISANYDDAKFSLRLVGNFPQQPVADFISTDNITLEEIKKQYACNDRNAKGYYCMSRWMSLPLFDEHVCVSDIDIIAINKIDKLIIEENLEKYQIVNLTRLKTKTGIEGGMMIFFLHKDVCEKIKNYSLDLLNSGSLEWSTDVKVRNFIYKNFDVKNLLKMQEVSKYGSFKIQDPWFIFSKVNKFKNLNFKYNIQ